MQTVVYVIAPCAFAWLGWNGLFTTIFLIFLFLCCQGFIFPNSSALTLARFGHNAGSASALMGAIQMSIGALASAMVSFFKNNSPMPMTAAMACSSITAFFFLPWAKDKCRESKPGNS